MATVLIVDDSKFMRLTLKNLIEKKSGGKHVVIGEAEDSATALQKYKELKPDIVTMDIILPVDGGLKAVTDIILFDPKACILMVTAMGQEKIIEEAMGLGAKGFVIKPVNPDKLLSSLDILAGK
jgi:two-component system, chemotaxis family, chemotaxis protein CheY